MKDKYFYIFDIETTSADISSCLLLEAAILLIKNRKIEAKFYLRTNISVPSFHISAKHIQIPSNLSEAFVINKIRKFLSGNHPITGWGLFFDYNFMKKKKIVLRNTKRDLMLIVRKKLNLKKNPSFDSICTKYNITSDVSVPHTALGDVYRTYEFLKFLWGEKNE